MCLHLHHQTRVVRLHQNGDGAAWIHAGCGRYHRHGNGHLLRHRLAHGRDAARRRRAYADRHRKRSGHGARLEPRLSGRQMEHRRRDARGDELHQEDDGVGL